jgi:transitional endoplasmic reticulum ATPase
MPNEECRFSILKKYLSTSRIAPDVDLENIAKQTVNYTGKDLKEICQRVCHMVVTESMEQQQQQSTSLAALIHHHHLQHVIDLSPRLVTNDELQKLQGYANRLAPLNSLGQSFRLPIRK